MARAESFTEEGAWPSAQLMVLSAVALDAAVVLHLNHVKAHPQSESWDFQPIVEIVTGVVGCAMLWRIFQGLILFLVIASNIKWKWTPNGLVASLAGVAAAFLATLALTAVLDLVARARAALRLRRPAEHEDSREYLEWQERRRYELEWHASGRPRRNDF